MEPLEQVERALFSHILTVAYTGAKDLPIKNTSFNLITTIISSVTSCYTKNTQPHRPLNIAFRYKLNILNLYKIILLRLSQDFHVPYVLFFFQTLSQHLLSNYYEFKQEKTKTNKT